MAESSTDFIDVVLALDGPAALAKKREVEARLSAIRGDTSKLEEREALKRENEALGVRLGEWREEQKRNNLRRNMAGIGSPFYEVVAEWLAMMAPLEGEHAAPNSPRRILSVQEFEAVALERLAERERKSAERKAAKK
jgi:hypothetical protein